MDATKLYGPGYAGYLHGQDQAQVGQQRKLQALSGIARILQEQEEMRQAAAMSPYKQQLFEAQAAQAKALAEQRAEERALQAALPEIIGSARGEDGQVNYNMVAEKLFQTPGGLQHGMDFRKAEEDRAARVTKAEADLEQKRLHGEQVHQFRMSNLQRQQDRDAEKARHDAFMRELAAQRTAIMGMNAGNRNVQTINTAEGVMERGPDGQWRPVTVDGRPVRPPSLTAGDRGDRRDSMSIYQQVENDPQVKLYKSFAPKFDTSLQYFNEVLKDPAKQSNAQDLAMVKTFVSQIHPKGDQISNLDMRNIGQLPGLDERIVGAIMNVLDGKQLQPKMRADIMRLMAAQFGNLNAQVVGIEDRRRLEAQNFGLDPDRSVPKIGRRQSQPAQTGTPRVIDFNDLPTRR